VGSRVNRDREKVFVGIPQYGPVESAFYRSMVHLLVFDAQNKKRIVNGGYHLTYGTSNLPHGRNQICLSFLDDADADWLWFVDDDETFDPDVLERMVHAAHPKDRPVLGALVYSYDQGQSQRTRPTIWSWRDGQPFRWDTAPRAKLLGPEHGVHATGSGCVLLHRTVIQAMYDKYGTTSWPFFKYGEWTNPAGEADIMGEDLTFFARVGALGFPVHVDTRIECGHVKRFVVDSGVHYSELPWEKRLSETYVVVPVKDNLHLTRSLLEQLEKQGGYEAVFVYDNGSGEDTKKYLRRQRVAEVFDAAGKNIYEMWNAGITEALRRWPKANIAILNNDLKLGDNFLNGLAGQLRASPMQELVAVGPNYDGRWFDGDIKQVTGIAAGTENGTGGLPFFAFMVKGEFFTAGLPMFDENFGLWFGDNDFALTCDRMGLTYGIVKETTVEHIGGGSQTVNQDDWTEQKAKDRAYFGQKWPDVKVVAA
jgi:glycosyltransferase involved in cell wall biosynthesis